MTGHPKGIPIPEIRDAILHRNVELILTSFFNGSPPRLNQGFRYESDLWDFKGACPGHGPVNLAAWAGIAADVLAFHNNEGGILFFGIDDTHFSYAGTATPIDAKQFNDKIRKYSGDKFWVTYCRAFQDGSGRHLGMALVPRRGLQVTPFFSGAPLVGGRQLFQAGDIAIRVGDESRILRGEKASDYLATLHIPFSDARFLVKEPSYRVMRPDWDEFVPRDALATPFSRASKTIVRSSPL